MSEQSKEMWAGLKDSARERLATRDYSRASLGEQLAGSGLPVSEVIAGREQLKEEWIPGVELFARRVYQQKDRGYFGELTRLSEGVLAEIGLEPKQWASALMHRDSAKGFHIHPPYVPEDASPEAWFERLYQKEPHNYSLRTYEREQWDVMFFLTGYCEILLVDERAGLPRRTMRFVIASDSRPGPDNAAVIIPPGVAHALRNIGNEDLIMVYGTSTVFNPEWEGRIGAEVEQSMLPEEWQHYLRSGC